MAERRDIWFVSDVHLGLKTEDPQEREARFIAFLKGIPKESAKMLFLLGDIWDFWYEYRDVVPRVGGRVVAALVALVEAGVEVWFCPGNHDIWTYSYLEQLGIRRFDQPYYLTLEGKVFCLGHGDQLGGASFGSSLTSKIFHWRFAQRLFSALHPWLAYRFGEAWSGSSRRKHGGYRFRGEEEPLYRFALEASARRRVDYFVFGHFHDAVDLRLPTGARFCILKDWMDGGMPCGVFNGTSFELRSPGSPAR